MLTCEFPFCGYQTKIQTKFKMHQNTHTRKCIKKEKRRTNTRRSYNNIHFKCEHHISYFCGEDMDNSSSRIFCVKEHTDCNGIYCVIF